MNIDDMRDRAGHLLGRHLEGKTDVTVCEIVFDEDAGECGLRLAGFNRILWLDFDTELPFVRYAGNLLQLHPVGDKILIF